MSKDTTDSLIERLSHLERTSRRLKWLGLFLIIALTTVVVMWLGLTNTSRVVEAQEFLLRDRNGKIRARLGIGDVLRVGGGKVEFWTGREFADKASLQLFDQEGKPLIALALEESPALYITGSDGVDRAWLEVSGDSPRLVFRDGLKNQRVVLGSFKLWSTNNAGGQYVDLKGEGEDRPTSSLVLIGEDGKILLKTP